MAHLLNKKLARKCTLSLWNKLGYGLFLADQHVHCFVGNYHCNIDWKEINLITLKYILLPTIYTCIDTIGVVIYIKAKMVWQQALSSKIHPSPWLTTGNSKVWFVCFSIQTMNIPFFISDICTPPPQLSGFSLQWYKPCTLTLTLTYLWPWQH